MSAPVVFVHGNPETDAIWVPLLAALDLDNVERLSPPGFGAPIPAEFGCTVLEYRDWLIAGLEAIGEPVHLVGHDWGGGHVMNVAMTRPDLLLSWASDNLGTFHPDYEWHELAQKWQAMGPEGDRAEELFSTDVDQRAEANAGYGFDPAMARALAEGQGQEMGRAILALYRSARQPTMKKLGAHLSQAAARPGLALLPAEDHLIGTDEQRRHAADAAGARTAILPGLGHWWMVQDPGRGAAALLNFWDTLLT